MKLIDLLGIIEFEQRVTVKEVKDYGKILNDGTYLYEAQTNEDLLVNIHDDYMLMGVELVYMENNIMHICVHKEDDLI